jgi:hypothetical protein
MELFFPASCVLAQHDGRRYTNVSYIYCPIFPSIRNPQTSALCWGFGWWVCDFLVQASHFWDTGMQSHATFSAANRHNIYFVGCAHYGERLCNSWSRFCLFGPTFCGMFTMCYCEELWVRFPGSSSWVCSQYNPVHFWDAGMHSHANCSAANMFVDSAHHEETMEVLLFLCFCESSACGDKKK